MSHSCTYVCEPVQVGKAWDEAVTASSQGTLFSESLFINSCGRDFDLFLIRKGEHVRAGLCVLLTKDGKGSELDDLVIHNGLFFIEDEDRKSVKARFERFSLTEFIIDFLVHKYTRIEIALAPGFEDMRPFLWHNYHQPGTCGKFALDLRYTSYLDIASLRGSGERNEETDCFRQMDTLRQRHVRRAIRAGARVRQTNDVQRLCGYYRALMDRQADPAPIDKIERMGNLFNNLIAGNRAAIYEVETVQGSGIYSVLYAWDNKRAYYLFGAGHPEISEPYQGTYAHWGAFLDLANRSNVRQVDLEGVNSPKRGWFKLGFGGRLVSYYQLYMQ